MRLPTRDGRTVDATISTLLLDVLHRALLDCWGCGQRPDRGTPPSPISARSTPPPGSGRTMLTDEVGIPAPLAYLNCFVELIGGLLLIVGLLTRPVAFVVGINMLIAAIVMWPNGVLTWAAYPLSLMISAVVILLAGPMAYSLDTLLLSRQGRADRPARARASGSA